MTTRDTDDREAAFVPSGWVIGRRIIDGKMIVRKIYSIERLGVGDQFLDEDDESPCKILVIVGTESAVGLEEARADMGEDAWRRVESITAVSYLSVAQKLPVPADGPDHHSARTP